MGQHPKPPQKKRKGEKKNQGKLIHIFPHKKGYIKVRGKEMIE